MPLHCPDTAWPEEEPLTAVGPDKNRHAAKGRKVCNQLELSLPLLPFDFLLSPRSGNPSGSTYQCFADGPHQFFLLGHFLLQVHLVSQYLTKNLKKNIRYRTTDPKTGAFSTHHKLENSLLHRRETRIQRQITHMGSCDV
jgi:hypothetical protein